jgi:ribosomal protein L37AE/L43A
MTTTLNDRRRATQKRAPRRTPHACLGCGSHKTRIVRKAILCRSCGTYYRVPAHLIREVFHV